MPSAPSQDPDASPTTRTCSICEQEQPLTDAQFYRRRNYRQVQGPPPEAFEPCCKRCDHERRQARGRRFGVEIEFVGVHPDRVYRELRRRGVPTYETSAYTHIVVSGWKIVSDGSLDGMGYELVSPPLKGACAAAQVRKACEALAAAGARVNRSCGLHVHYEVNDLDARAFGRLFRLWFYNQAAMNELVAPSRRRTSWALPLRDEEVREIERLQSMVNAAAVVTYFDRYRSLNAQCYPRYGTVESRQHQGTTNADKILAWVAFGKAMISVAKSREDLSQAQDATELIDELAAKHRLAAARARYLKVRAAEFAPARRPGRRRLGERVRVAAERERLMARYSAEETCYSTEEF